MVSPHISLTCHQAAVSQEAEALGAAAGTWARPSDLPEARQGQEIQEPRPSPDFAPCLMLPAGPASQPLCPSSLAACGQRHHGSALLPTPSSTACKRWYTSREKGVMAAGGHLLLGPDPPPISTHLCHQGTVVEAVAFAGSWDLRGKGGITKEPKQEHQLFQDQEVSPSLGLVLSVLVPRKTSGLGAEVGRVRLGQCPGSWVPVLALPLLAR